MGTVDDEVSSYSEKSRALYSLWFGQDLENTKKNVQSLCAVNAGCGLYDKHLYTAEEARGDCHFQWSGAGLLTSVDGPES